MSGKLRGAFSLIAMAVIVGACSSSGATASPSLKIGVVTDVGTITDKNFNQYSYEGAKAAADSLGATVNYVVPADASDYTKDIQGFVDQKYSIIVTVGFNLGDATIKAAKANADIVVAVRDFLRRHPHDHVVLDPVMVATSGDRLLDDDAIAAMRDLIPLASLITPNLALSLIHI